MNTNVRFAIRPSFERPRDGAYFVSVTTYVVRDEEEEAPSGLSNVGVFGQLALAEGWLRNQLVEVRGRYPKAAIEVGGQDCDGVEEALQLLQLS